MRVTVTSSPYREQGNSVLAVGPRPDEIADRLRITPAELAKVPQLVPVYGHRYLPGTEGESGHPVLSVCQSDIIDYGNDLADYIRHEFTGRSGDLSKARATVGFWSYFVEDGSPEVTFNLVWAGWTRGRSSRRPGGCSAVGGLRGEGSACWSVRESIGRCEG
ncbi:hypothetical protein [Streptomyces sp. NRRL WC-3742]|uniref:hypothetical protein n=1 Tax=Streptomyces sp. NRRL WC-3742 TaxID=1463934 RepID=UPI0018FEB7D8|nr:hypothetical protein [Streptomyces sp. NRRL WC-3742]